MYPLTFLVIHFPQKLLVSGTLTCLSFEWLSSLLTCVLHQLNLSQDGGRALTRPVALSVKTNLSRLQLLPSYREQRSIQHNSSQMESGKRQYSLAGTVVHSLPNLMNSCQRRLAFLECSKQMKRKNLAAFACRIYLVQMTANFLPRSKIGDSDIL